MSNYPVYGVGLKGKLPNPLIPQLWAYAAKASSLEFVSIMSGKQENQFLFLRSKKPHSSLLSIWWLWGLYLSLKSSSSFLGNESSALACWAWSSSLNVGAWCHLRCCILAASGSFSLPLWISEISKDVSGGAGHLCLSRGNKSLVFPFVMEKCVSHVKNEMKSALCSQHPHLSQPESLHWFKVDWDETVFSAFLSVNKVSRGGI